MNFGFGDKPMNRKIVVSLLSTSILVSVHFAEAQQPTKVPRIGFLLTPSRSAVSESLDAFRQGLRELGYVEGQNILIEYRYPDGKLERLPDLAAELVHLKIDVIVAGGGGMAVQAAKKASSATPIVFTGINDPVASGIVASLAQPAGNITGLSLGGYELHGKRLELLKETVPSVSRVAFFCYPASLTEPSALKETQASAKVLEVEVQSLNSRVPRISRQHSKPQPNGGHALSPSKRTRYLWITETGSWSSQQRTACRESIRGGSSWRMAV